MPPKRRDRGMSFWAVAKRRATTAKLMAWTPTRTAMQATVKV